MATESARQEDTQPVNLNESENAPLFFPPGLPLQVEVEGVSFRMNSIAVGMIAERFLIMKYPNTGIYGSIDSKMFKGNKIVVRYINGGDVFGFQSELIEMITSPLKLLFISCPSLIVRKNLRSNKRVECSLPARLKPSTKDENMVFEDGLITDISMAGCRFTMMKAAEQARHEMNGTVMLHIEIPGVEGGIELSGSVKNVQRDSQRISMGVQFAEIDEQKKEKFMEFIATLEKFAWDK